MRDWFQAFVGKLLSSSHVQELEIILTNIDIIDYSLLIWAVEPFTQTSYSLLIDIDACSQLETNQTCLKSVPDCKYHLVVYLLFHEAKI